MARPIKETPVLLGKDAAEFVDKVRASKGQTVSDKTRARMRANFERLRAVSKFWKFRWMVEGAELFRLEKCDPCTEFDCGDSDLNEFIVKDALNYFAELLAVTYVLVKDKRVIAFFSVMNDAIRYDQETMSGSKWRFVKKHIPRTKHFKSFPAVKIGRLAVASEYKDRDIGTTLLDYIKEYFVSNNKTGCRFITVDAYRASLGFYEKNDFQYLASSDAPETNHTRQMFFDLSLIRGEGVGLGG